MTSALKLGTVLACWERNRGRLPFGGPVTHIFVHPHILRMTIAPITFNWIALML